MQFHGHPVMDVGQAFISSNGSFRVSGEYHRRKHLALTFIVCSMHRSFTFRVWMISAVLSKQLTRLVLVQTMSHIVADGKSNWLEGMILICKFAILHDPLEGVRAEISLGIGLYVVIAVSFWFYPGMQ